MLTCIIRRNAEPNVIHMTQESIMKELSTIPHAEMLLEDTWTEGLKKVRTPFVCLLEAECVLSANYLSSNYGLINKATGTSAKGTGGYNKLAMISSCLGVKKFENRIYNYKLQKIEDGNLKYYQIRPSREKKSSVLYHVQVGFVPGAIMRYTSIKDVIETIPWDSKNLVELSTALSFHLWNTNRRIEMNPNTTYVSGEEYLEDPPGFDPQLPDLVANIFANNFVLTHNLTQGKMTADV